MDNYHTHHQDHLHQCPVDWHSIFSGNCHDDLGFLIFFFVQRIYKNQKLKTKIVYAFYRSTYRHCQYHHHKHLRVRLYLCPFDPHSVHRDNYRRRLPVCLHLHAQNQLDRDYTPSDSCQDHLKFRRCQRPDLNVNIKFRIEFYRRDIFL